MYEDQQAQIMIYYSIKLLDRVLENNCLIKTEDYIDILVECNSALAEYIGEGYDSFNYKKMVAENKDYRYGNIKQLLGQAMWGIQVKHPDFTKYQGLNIDFNKIIFINS